MGKFSGQKKLNKEQLQELLIDFADAVSSLKNSVEAASLVRDLLSESEAVMLARRIQIARLLYNGYKYQEIQKELNVSPPTIARVQAWLTEYGDGFRLVFERTKNKRKPEKEVKSEWSRFKNKYPIYFWPQLLLEEIVRTANKREKQKLFNVVSQMKQKTKLSKQLNILLNKKM